MHNDVNGRNDVIVNVAYATPDVQAVVTLKMPAGTTVEEAVKASGLLTHFPDIDLSVNPVGIFGKVCRLDQVIKSDDRIEIYRPLRYDPKEARRQRAVKK